VVGKIDDEEVYPLRAEDAPQVVPTGYIGMYIVAFGWNLKKEN